MYLVCSIRQLRMNLPVPQQEKLEVKVLFCTFVVPLPCCLFAFMPKLVFVSLSVSFCTFCLARSRPAQRKETPRSREGCDRQKQGWLGVVFALMFVLFFCCLLLSFCCLFVLLLCFVLLLFLCLVVVFSPLRPNLSLLPCLCLFVLFA
jgi:hypothetical protein